MRSAQSRLILAVATLSLLTACGDDGPTDVDLTASGTVAFSFTGGGGGTYNATGPISATDFGTSGAATTAWATGWRDNTTNTTWIAASTPLGGGRVNLVGLVIRSQASGSNAISEDCDVTSGLCSTMTLALDFNPTTGALDNACTLSSGTITISSITSTTVAGTFSGSGLCVTSSEASSTFTVTGGSFNVPLLPFTP